jgi:hypothetical protein
MTYPARKRLLLICVLAGLLACGACGKPTPETAPDPYWPFDGWRTCAPEQQGMDSEMLAQTLCYETICLDCHYIGAS